LAHGDLVRGVPKASGIERKSGRLYSVRYLRVARRFKTTFCCGGGKIAFGAIGTPCPGERLAFRALAIAGRHSWQWCSGFGRDLAAPLKP
jgi:hypothetical protein